MPVPAATVLMGAALVRAGSRREASASAVGPVAGLWCPLGRALGRRLPAIGSLPARHEAPAGRAWQVIALGGLFSLRSSAFPGGCFPFGT